MKRKVAILGANDSICCLISKAKDKGFETHVFSWSNTEPGSKLADYFYEISIDEQDQILEQCQKIGISGICSITSDYAVSTVNYVATKLGLIGNSNKTSTLCRNKFLMREALREAGLFVPVYHLVSNANDLDKLSLSYPLIVKPTDKWGSRGVTRCDNVDMLKSAVQFAIKESIEGKAILESFIEGEEYSAECISINGKVTILSYTHKMTSGFPHYVEIGHEQLANIIKELKDKIESVIIKATNALFINNSAVHVEFKIMPNNEIGIIEIGARMGGDCIGTHLTPLCTGIDYVGLVLELACGDKILENALVPKTLQHVAVHYIVSEDSLRQYLDLKQNNSSCIYFEKDIQNEDDCNTFDGETRYGYYVTVN